MTKYNNPHTLLTLNFIMTSESRTVSCNLDPVNAHCFDLSTKLLFWRFLLNHDWKYSSVLVKYFRRSKQKLNRTFSVASQYTLNIPSG